MLSSFDLTDRPTALVLNEADHSGVPASFDGRAVSVALTHELPVNQEFRSVRFFVLLSLDPGVTALPLQQRSASRRLRTSTGQSEPAWSLVPAATRVQGLDACTVQAGGVLVQRRSAGIRPMPLVPWRGSTRFDSNSRWRSHRSTAFAAPPCNHQGSLKLVSAPAPFVGSFESLLPWLMPDSKGVCFHLVIGALAPWFHLETQRNAGFLVGH